MICEFFYFLEAKREALKRRAEQNKTMPKLERVEPLPIKTDKGPESINTQDKNEHQTDKSIEKKVTPEQPQPQQ